MTVPPIRREIVVATDPARAFDLFTQDIGAWWPLRRVSVYEGDGVVAFDGSASEDFSSPRGRSLGARAAGWRSCGCVPTTATSMSSRSRRPTT